MKPNWIFIPTHFDPAPLLLAIGDDAETYTTLCDQFVATVRAQIDAIAGTGVTPAARSLSDEIHSLKGSLGIFHAGPALQILTSLSAAAAAGDAAMQRNHIALLVTECAALAAEIGAHCDVLIPAAAPAASAVGADQLSIAQP